MKKILFLLGAMILSANLFAQTWVAQTSGLTGVSLNCVSAVDANVCWIGGNAGNILVTTNAGTTWVNKSNATVGANDVYAICALSATKCFVSTAPAATFVFMTTDGGTTWTQVFTEAGGFIDDIKFKDANNGLMYGDPTPATGGTRWSLWKTTNGGVNWDSTGMYLLRGSASEAGWNNAMTMQGNNVWFGTNNTRVYYSTNFGASWSFGATTGSANSYSVAFNGQKGFSGQTVAVTSTNGGATWASVTLPGSGTCYSFCNVGGKFWYNRSNIIYGSTDNGANFASQYTGTAGAVFQAMSFVQSGSTIRGWSVSNTGLIAMYNETVAPPVVDPTTICQYSSSTPFNGWWGHAADVLGDTMYVAGGGTGAAPSNTVSRYAISTGTFSTGVPLPTVKSCGVLITAGNALYYIGGTNVTGPTGTAEGLSYKYTPAAGWTTIAPTPNPRNGATGMAWGDSVIFVVSGGWSTYSTIVDVYRIATNTWSTSTPIPVGRRSFAGGITNGKIFVCAGFSGTFRNDIYVGTIGANANTITWATGPVVPFPAAITGTSRPGGTAVNGKFYLITGEVAGGATTNGHDTVYVFDAALNNWTSQRLVGRTPNQASNHWASICNTILPNGKIKILIPGGASGTHLPGLYAIQPDPCTVTNIGNNETPVNYNLSQNYPNPFNPTTKISYAIPTSGLVTLKVYDVLGKEVATLVNEMKNAGSYIVDFNAASLSSGVYFYRLDVNGFVSTKKMTLLK